MHFCITSAIFHQFSRRDVKLVAFLTQLYISSYSKTLWQNETNISLLWSGINAKKMSFHCTLSHFIATYCCWLCRYCRYWIGFSKQNVYVNELNIVLLYAFCSDEFKYRYNASNLYRATHDNGGWRRSSMMMATERCWVERLSCKGSRT